MRGFPFLSRWLDPARRFERAYGEMLAARFETFVWPSGASLPFDRLFVPIRGLDAALAASPHVILTGPAGVGKTTALAHLARVQARALAAGRPRAHIPIWVDARELAPDSRAVSGNLAHLVNLDQSLVARCPTEFFADALASGRAWVLIDDLDALPSDRIDQVRREFSSVRLVAASRYALPGLDEFVVPGFRDSDIRAFAQNWAPVQSEAFLAALKASQVPRSLTASPLALALLRQVWQPDRPLPISRTALFDAYRQSVLGQGAGTKELEDAALAIQRGRPCLTALPTRGEDWLRAGRNRSEEFVHELWQAYFAARALREAGDLQPLSEFLQAPRWEETVLFYAGLGDATELIRALLEREDIGLAGRALAHARAVSPGLSEQLVKILVSRAWEGDGRAILALSEMNSGPAIEALAARLHDPDPAVRRRAVTVLGELRLDRAVDFVLPLLRDADPGVRAKAVEALGLARTDRVIEPLLVVLRGEGRSDRRDTGLRVAAAHALGRVGSDKAAPALIVDLQMGEPEMRAAAAESLKRMASPLTIKPLRGVLQSGDEMARHYAADVLAAIDASGHTR